jgi:hypothetical protein
MSQLDTEPIYPGTEAGDQLNAIARAVLSTAGLTIAMSTLPASAAEKLRVGKAVPEAFSFTPLDIGMRKGLFAKHRHTLTMHAMAGSGTERDIDRIGGQRLLHASIAGKRDGFHLDPKDDPADPSGATQSNGIPASGT